MTRNEQIAVVTVVLLIAVAGALIAWTLGGPAPVYSPVQASSLSTALLTQAIPAGSPNAAQLRRGQYLARVGDCISCHTREGGAPFAGGLGLNTPFGTVYSTNLTRDPHYGIGGLTADAFFAVLHNGRGPKGLPVYPAMPYNYFTKLTRTDSDALLAFLKTIPASSDQRPVNSLRFPLNVRFLVHGWNLLNFTRGTFVADPMKSAQWNRGAYLVTGLGHCGACHTPKNLLAGDHVSHALWGGTLDHWVAPDLTANPQTGLGRWSADDIVGYLRFGRSRRANAAGPMADVVSHSTSLMDEGDLQAIALYLKALPASPTRATNDVPDAAMMRRGAAIFSDACAACHLARGTGQNAFVPSLAQNAMLQQRDPTGLVHLLLAGGRSAPTRLRPTAVSMPSFAAKLNDQQIADVASFVRNNLGNRAQAVTREQVGLLRAQLGLQSIRLTDSSGDHQ